ncbi:MAG: GNAT family N-acetyltransferase [Lachnospiraceae bacterium]|nr:GNAT family N-acetyltransferase [Lachnospiraceae bacterium]MBP5668712.1 GNAT family N-acetyltransferase [Lachnospiraceae bacterium]MCR5498804.1 GNAT family N-acetyltransferase [Acetatifactor sp.]
MPEMEKLDFKPVTAEDYERLYPYTSAYGEGSCQHSPVSMYALYEKYGDATAISEGFLYVLRENLCDDAYRVYLAPLGGDEAALKEAYERIFADARAYGKKVKFLSLTQKHADFLEEAFPGRFQKACERDLAEYVYDVKTLSQFPGKDFAKRRSEIRKFWREYGKKAEVSQVTALDFDELLTFSETWIYENEETHDKEALSRELRDIRKLIAHYDELHLSGTVLRVDGKVEAFCIGSAINDQYYDIMIEKGVRDIPGVYRVVRQEDAKQRALQFSYMNYEEDVGVPGIRQLKESYGPAFLLKKYVMTEQ